MAPEQLIGSQSGWMVWGSKFDRRQPLKSLCRSCMISENGFLFSSIANASRVKTTDDSELQKHLDAIAPGRRHIRKSLQTRTIAIGNEGLETFSDRGSKPGLPQGHVQVAWTRSMELGLDVFGSRRRSQPMGPHLLKYPEERCLNFRPSHAKCILVQSTLYPSPSVHSVIEELRPRVLYYGLGLRRSGGGAFHTLS